MYAEGKGVSKDLIRAYMWSSLAADCSNLYDDGQVVKMRVPVWRTLQWWFQTCYPEDLDPLDEAPQHVSLNLP